MTGENTASATRPPRYSHGEISQRRSFGMLTSQIRIAGPKNSAVYFDNSAAPTAAPTASHHAPRPVSSTFARKNRTKLEATSSGPARVTITLPPPPLTATFRRIPPPPPTRSPPTTTAGPPTDRLAVEDP